MRVISHSSAFTLAQTARYRSGGHGNYVAAGTRDGGVITIGTHGTLSDRVILLFNFHQVEPVSRGASNGHRQWERCGFPALQGLLALRVKQVHLLLTKLDDGGLISYRVLGCQYAQQGRSEDYLAHPVLLLSIYIACENYRVWACTNAQSDSAAL